MPDDPAVRTAFLVRVDQIEAIDRLAKDADLNRSQAVRRLLDLGMKHWAAEAPTRQS